MIEDRTKVRINKNLKGSQTEHDYKLDDRGYMLGMAGRVYEVDASEETLSRRSGIDINCEEAGRTFRFSTSDVHLLDENDLPPLPTPTTFDPKHLDL